MEKLPALVRQKRARDAEDEKINRRFWRRFRSSMVRHYRFRDATSGMLLACQLLERHAALYGDDTEFGDRLRDAEGRFCKGDGDA